MNASTFNSLLAVIIVAAAINSIANMNGTTRHCIRVGILLIFIAGIGQAIGPLVAQWDHYIDTILYIGVIVLLVFNRRYKKHEQRETSHEPHSVRGTL